MRFLRLVFILVLAIILVGIALANRDVVTLSAFPADFGRYLGGRWTVDLPLFLVVFLAFAVGMLAGLIWEWLRESPQRSALRGRAERAEHLESQIDRLRERHAAPEDEVLAILDRSRSEQAALAAPGGTAAPSLRPGR